MTKSGLADSPFFEPPRQDGADTPPSDGAEDLIDKKRKPVKKTKDKEMVNESTKQSTDQPTSQSTDRPIDQSTNRSTDQLTEVDSLGPVVERPHAFYITQKVDRWLDKSVRYLEACKAYNRVNKTDIYWQQARTRVMEPATIIWYVLSEVGRS